MASEKILETYRESFTIQMAQEYSRSSRPAYSMVNLYCGAGIDTLCGIRALFKPLYGADCDKTCRKMYIDMSGRPCYSDASTIKFEEHRPPTLAIITPPCQDYASSAVNARGQEGDKGGGEFVKIPYIVQRMKPMSLFIENVGNMINFEEELVKVLLGLEQDCDMIVHAAIVSMQQYGDMENSWRIVIVAFNKIVGAPAFAYKIPMGDYSDSVSFVAADVATNTAEIPARFRRFITDFELNKRSQKQPGQLQKVAQSRPGHGPSWDPYACYDLGGQAPKCTTYGAGRHKPKGWRAGDSSNESYMFTPTDVLKQKNLSKTVLEFYEKHYHGSKLQGEMSKDAALYKWLGNGFSHKFGVAFCESIHRTLQLAGVPFDIETTVGAKHAQHVTHVQPEYGSWKTAVEARQAIVQARVSQTVASDQWDAGVHNIADTKVYSCVFDTAATQILLWDEQDEFLTNKRPARAIVQGAQVGSNFSASSRGDLMMACMLKSQLPVSVPKDSFRKAVMQLTGKESAMVLKKAQLVKVPVITAPREQLNKQLAGFPRFFVDLEFNLDIRQWKDGRSAMWKMDPEFPQDETRRLEIPIRWDAVSEEWLFEYVPIRHNSQAHNILLQHVHADRQKSRSTSSVIAARRMRVDKEEIGAYVLDLMNTDMAKKMLNVNLPEDFQKLMATIPVDKRLEVVFARNSDERQILGVKQTMAQKSFRTMSEAEFHRYFGHVGTGKNCVICALIKGTMRFIYKIKDKFIETRMGYFWDMDTITTSHRSDCGVKYYTMMRDRGSKTIKAFPLVFKDDFVDQFEIWLRRQRDDPIRAVYNYLFCTVIQADNDGVWMRKSARWLELIEKFGIRMHYTDKDRKESNSFAERTMGIVEVTAKSCMLERGLPPTDHVNSFMGAVWILNRFPPVSALARDPTDGDIARPLEMITYGWMSRRQCNLELSAFVLPGTLVLVHDAKALGSDLGRHKSEWLVAQSMLGRQLIAYCPTTKQERKTSSYSVFEGPTGVHWRDQLGVKYEPSKASRPLAGDVDARREAINTGSFIELAFGAEMQAKLKQVKMPKTMDMVKHVHSEEAMIISPPDIERLKQMLTADKKVGTAEVEKRISLPEPGIEQMAKLQRREPLFTVTDLPDEDDSTPTINQPPGDHAAEELAGFSGDEQPTNYGADDDVDVAWDGDAIMPMRERTEELRKRRQELRNKRKSSNPMSKIAAKEKSDKKVSMNKCSKTTDEMTKMLLENVPVRLIQENPKKVGSKSHKRYERYKSASTLQEMLNLGAVRGDLYNDMERGFIIVCEQGAEGEVDLKPVSAELLTTGGPLEEVQGATAALSGVETYCASRSKHEQWKMALEYNPTEVVGSQMSFAAVCKLLRIPSAYQKVFHSWIIEVSQGDLNEASLGVYGQRKAKCQVGITIPAPSGEVWSEMVSLYSKSQNYSENSDQKQRREEAEAMRVGANLARIFDAVEQIKKELQLEEVIMANKTKVRAKDHIEGTIPPPKGVNGVYRIDDPVRRTKFIESMIKEISALTEMGTISHLHTAEELLEKYGVDISVCRPVPTLFVFENKQAEGETNPELAMAKGRMCMEGTPRWMQHGVHYDSVYAATPGQDSIMFFNALVVFLKLARRAFDVGNAYGWAPQPKKLAMDYPRGLEQYNSQGSKLYMALHKNTYGKPDGANLWYKCRDGFWLDFFNDEAQNPGWSCRQLIMEQSLFEFKYTPPQGDNVDIKVKVQIAYLLAWSDDCDMAGTSEAMLLRIETASHERWKVKSVSADFMLGVRRTLTIEQDDVWVMTLTQEEFIDGLVGAYKEQLKAAGWETRSPVTPVPKGEYLSLSDETPEEEWQAVTKWGFKAVCGSLLWVSRFAHKEIGQGISVCCRVMSKPSKKAWAHAMQMLAWLRAHKLRGIRYRSDNNTHGLVVTCDASNKPDPHDGKCQQSFAVMWMGGTIASLSQKLNHIGYGSPANEQMTLRAASSKVIKFRNMFEELGLFDVIAEPTKIYCDNDTAISWVKTGKITDGNQYLALSYHQPRQWEKAGQITICGVHTKDNFSDLGTKPCGPDEYEEFLMTFCGYKPWVIKHPRNTMTFT